MPKIICFYKTNHYCAIKNINYIQILRFAQNDKLLLLKKLEGEGRFVAEPQTDPLLQGKYHKKRAIPSETRNLSNIKRTRMKTNILYLAPLVLIFVAVPLSLLEAFVATLIAKKV